ncbi:hypothetical protein [Priestia koreensis]|uniref:hypothetical protein n=1 Tax=Priestia koreensis TaxID=284581 RepID=UPI001F582DBF|nr:hypothetical protein [Priestia koreensis]UNL83547.1 hypothetical protein IE339_15420 [Priestia koreensis]
MNFPIIHTNFWDAVIGIPLVLVFTQLIKLFFPIPKPIIPTIALILGLLFSILFAHPHSLISGIFMGYFYGYAAIGSYAGLKTSITAFRRDKKHYY